MLTRACGSLWCVCVALGCMCTEGGCGLSVSESRVWLGPAAEGLQVACALVKKPQMVVCFSEWAILGGSETLGVLILASDAEPSHPS